MVEIIEAFEFAIKTSSLAATWTKMVIISNSSKRAVLTDDKLKFLGFDMSLFLGAITSGELTMNFFCGEMILVCCSRKKMHPHEYMTWNDRGAISRGIRFRCGE